jgi:hypothetical protein
MPSAGACTAMVRCRYMDAHSAFPAYLESTNRISAARYSLCSESVILRSEVAWTEVRPIVSNTGWWYGGNARFYTHCGDSWLPPAQTSCQFHTCLIT